MRAPVSHGSRRPTFRPSLGPVLAALALAGITAPASAQEHEEHHEAEEDRMHEHMHSVEFYTDPAMSGFPFSEAVRVGNLLFLSGQIGTGEDGLVPGGIGPETRQTLENIQATLEKYGSSMEEVVKCTVFLADIGEWPAMNEVYATFFPGNKPARSAVAGSGLALDSRVEIECIATVGLESATSGGR